MHYLTIFFFFSISLFGFDYHLKAYNITEGVTCFFGLPSQVNYVNGGNMINSCYIETSEGYVVVDSGPTYSYAQEAYRVMEKKKKLPVRYVINTASDEVHVLGSEFYKEQGAILISPSDYKTFLQEKESLVLTRLLPPEIMSHTRMVPMDKYITKDKKLVLGNTTLDIKTVKGDKRHIYLYIKDKKIVFAGDMLFNNRMVPLKYNRSLNVWEKGLSELEALAWTDVVSAHGYKTRRSALLHTKNYLSSLKSIVLKGLEDSKTKQELLDTAELPKFEEDRQYSYWHPINVASVYDEFKELEEKKKDSDKKSSLLTKMSHEIKRLQVKQKKKLEKVKIHKKKNKPKSKVISVKYVSFDTAIKKARHEKKIVLIKVRSTTCKYCDQLNRVIEHNNRVKKLLNNYYEVVSVNNDTDEIPLGLLIQSTPTLIFVQPNSKKVLMNLQGIHALGELLEILNEAIDDGHAGGYLKP